jgi:hypothetical protein
LLINLIRGSKGNSGLKAVLIVAAVVVVGYFGINLLNRVDWTFRSDYVSTNLSGESPKVKSVVSADKITKGRTAGERVYEFSLPPAQWVETSLLIQPNQEVMIHHFASNEPVKVNLGGMTDSRLQKPGTILPLYTSKNCAADPGVSSQVRYACIELRQPESLKFYVSNPVRVGVVIKNR